MKVYWTRFALNSLREIYDYYKLNASVSIARNIKDSILLSTHQLELQPFSGSTEISLQQLNEGHRYLLRGNYKIIYKVLEQKIFIVDVFDTRQNPTKIYRNTTNDSTLNEPDSGESYKKEK